MMLSQKLLDSQQGFTPYKAWPPCEPHTQTATATKKALPLPKGHSPYARAKRAEYAKQLEEAKALLLEAIRIGNRAESAVKDYSSILHREHRTQEACDFLLKHQHLFTDPEKFNNLYETLKRQVEPTGNSLNMILEIGPISERDSVLDIKSLFKNPTRISRVTITDQFAFVHFPSHSAARKTLEGFLGWNIYTVHWVSIDGVVQGQAACGYTFLKKGQSEEQRTQDSLEETTEDSVEENWSKVFERSFDEELPSLSRGPSENTAMCLLGRSLFETIY